MRTRRPPLLCELHAHSAWSDGALSLPDLVDTYGRNGFDVLCVTDHTIRTDGRWGAAGELVSAERYPEYLAAVTAEAERALAQYGLLVVPGLELTYDDEDPARAAHAVAVGLRSFVGVDSGLEAALAEARAAGAALIAAHPYEPTAAAGSLRGTGRWALEHARLAPLVDRFELVNRREFFGWVASARLPVVASGDFHQLEHLTTWKTLLPCAADEEDVVAYLRSGRPAYLVDLPETARLAAAA